MSIARGIMQMDRINVYPTTTTLVSINPPDLASSCNIIVFTVTVSNNRGVGFPVPTGPVFIKDNFTNTILASGSLSGGAATISTSLPTGSYSIYADYDGIVNNFGGSQSNPNVLYNVNILDTNATTTTAGISGGTTFCINASQTFTATVSSVHLGGPNIGSVAWLAEKPPFTFIVLGTDSTVVAGAASINVPGGTFTSTGVWTVFASYTGDGYCFGNSISAGLTVHSTIFSVNVSYASGSTLFCYAVPQTFTYNVSSSGAGTISGFFLLRSSLGYDLASTSASGSSTGFVVSFNILGLTAVDGVQNFFVQFTPDVGSCYNSATSSNTSVDVKSFLSQTPSAVNLMYSPPGGGTIFTVFNFTITVLKGSGVGPIDGAGSLNGSGTLFRHDADGNYYVINNNVHIYDYGSSGSGSYSISGLPTSTVGIVGRWNGNSCYATTDSLELPITVSPIIH